jgi:predicted DsbA family dithiol-disulfide isomerase
VPFELHPEIPPAGIPRDLAFPAAYRQQVEAGMQRLAGEVGLTLRSHDRLINSRPTLQAAEFARDTGHFRAMHHELFKPTGTRAAMSRIWRCCATWVRRSGSTWRP